MHHFNGRDRLDRQSVLFSQVRDQLPPADPLVGNARLPVGVDLDGKLRLLDLASQESAHALVAGTNGSGKSEWLRSAIAGLLLTNTPETLRLMLIDPKYTAFADLKESSFLHRPIVFPTEESVAEVLSGLVEEMEARYPQLQASGSDTLTQHVRKMGRPTPRIVCVCDEYADLVLGDKRERREVEEQINRLGQKARAAGIHLIIATQQPSRKIIQGTLDTNMSARVGLRTTKAEESRMLLGEPGAEALLGNGDLLFKTIGAPVRLQGLYLTPEERTHLFRAPSAAFAIR